MKQMKNNKYLSFGCFIFNYFSKINSNFNSKICILVILSSLFLLFCGGGSKVAGRKIVSSEVAHEQSYVCTNGTPKESITLPIGMDPVADKKSCNRCDVHYRVASGPELTEVGSTCVTRTCAVEGEEPCSTCYAGFVRSGHTSDGMSTSVLSESTCVQIDSDNDKLIDITTLTQLHNMRNNLAGTSYKTDASTVAGECGTYGDVEGEYTTALGSCMGYELMNDLSFDTDTDGTHDSDGLDTADKNLVYFPVGSNKDGGWEPIVGFATTFNGNGNTITGLAIRRPSARIGMFGNITTDAVIRNINLADNLAEYYIVSGKNIPNSVHVGGLVGNSKGTIIGSSTSGKAKGPLITGGLVGFQKSLKIESSHATGTVSYISSSTTPTTNFSGGGLVGRCNAGKIITSSATGAVTGGDGKDLLGGLVGRLVENGEIITSSATGAVTGGDGNDQLGGLVGESLNSQIITSSATGAVTGGDGTNYLGGLVGNFRVDRDKSGIIVASYATGAVTGGADVDNAGGLIGRIETLRTGSVILGGVASIVTVIASSAAGAIIGDASDDFLGGLVGNVDGDSGKRVTITASYATGDVTGTGSGGTNSDVLGGLVGFLGGSSKIIASYANNNNLLPGGGGNQGFGSLVGSGSGADRVIESYGFFSFSSGTPNLLGGTPSSSITTAAGLISATSGNAGVKWNQVTPATATEPAIHTLGAWFFETGVAPKLQFNDYDGGGTVYSCSSSGNYFTITIGGNDIETTRVCSTEDNPSLITQ